MPRASAAVLGTDREVKSARTLVNRTDYRVRGAPGLQLRVTKAGTKSWAIAYKSPRTSKWSKVTLGQYPAMGLAEAKKRAMEVGASILGGHDPIHDRQKTSSIETFAALAGRYMSEHKKRNAREGRLSRTTLEAHRILDVDVYPKIGKLRADAVTKHHVSQVVETIADRGAYVASDRALGLIRAIYNWACGTGRVELNPTTGLKKRNASRPRTRVLTAEELSIFWRTISADRNGITQELRDIYRLQLLTGTRIGEITGATIHEVDLEFSLWTIPAERTKALREHAVPLSPQASAVFREAIRRREAAAGPLSREVPWIFPSPKIGNGPMHPHAATTALLRLRGRLADNGIRAAFNTHDLRRTVATSLGELGFSEAIIERVLNHAPKSIAGKHYNHARNIGQVRAALDQWAIVLLSSAAVEAPAHRSD